MTPSPSLQAWGHGVFSLDAHYIRPAFDAIHLIVEAGRAAIIDTATQSAVPTVLAALAQLGLERDCVDWIILTHVHLDHAGGAGALLRHLPKARVVVHPRGAPHMINPERLWQGVVQVYGAQQAQALYGALVPIPAERVVPAADGHRVLLAGRPLQCIDAPGHARHHLVVWDEISHEVYTGDAFGLAYPELRVAGRPFVMPSSTPTQFDPQAMRQTVQRIADLQPRAAYLTHGSHLAHPAQHAPDLLRRLDAYITMAHTVHAQVGPDPAQLGPALERGMTELLTQALHEHGCTLPPATQHALLELDIRLNAAGLLHWLLHS